MTISFRQWVFILIALISSAVFFPSLYHLSKGDQDAFLVETLEDQSFPELVANTYSYTRSRALAVGDQILFRPLFYLMLAFERWIWGYQFVLWQLVGIICHLLVLWQAYRILNLISAGGFGAGLLLLFSVTHLSQEMIIWHHINPYMVAVFLILKSLEHFILFLNELQRSQKHIVRIVLYLTIGSFIYEYCLIAALMFLIVLCFHQRSQNAFNKSWVDQLWEWKIFSIPAISYGLISSVDYLLRSESLNITETVKSSGTALFATLFKIITLSWAGPFIPSFLPIHQDDAHTRLKIESYSLDGFIGQFNGAQLSSQLNLILLLLLVVWLILVVYRYLDAKEVFSAVKKQGRFNKGSRDITTENYVGYLCLFLGIGYILMLAGGRFSMRGEEYLLNSLYHFYPMILFNIIVILSWRKRIFLNWQKDLTFLTSIIIVLAVGLNGYQTFQTNRLVARLSEDQRLKENGPVKNFYLCLKYNAQGLNYSKQKRYQKAILSFNQAIAQSPNYDTAYNNRGIVYRNLNMLDLALADYNKAIKLKPLYFKWYVNRGNIYLAMHQDDKALRDFSLAILLGPEFSEAYVNRGNLYSSKGKLQQALDDYNQAIKLDQKYYEAFHNRALIYTRTGNYDLAIKDFNKAIEINPLYSEGYNDLGAVMFQINRYEEAIELFKKATFVDPFFYQAHLNLGRSYYKTGSFDLALKQMDAYIENFPDSGFAIYNRSLVHQALSQLDKAKEDAFKAKSLGFAVPDEYLKLLNP